MDRHFTLNSLRKGSLCHHDAFKSFIIKISKKAKLILAKEILRNELNLNVKSLKYYGFLIVHFLNILLDKRLIRGVHPS